MHHHPDRHDHHHEVFCKGNKTERDVAVSADAGTFEIALLDIDGLANRDRADGAGEENMSSISLTP